MAKNSAKTVLSIIGIIVLLILAINVFGTRADIVEGVTGDKIKQVKPGMRLEEVVSILGKPFTINASKGVHYAGCRNPRSYLEMDINSTMDIRSIVDEIYTDTNYCYCRKKEDIQVNHMTLIYTRPVTISWAYPMLWVHLDRNYEVIDIYAKRYAGFLVTDDPCIYSFSWVTDPTIFEMSHDTMEIFVNEVPFNACFN